MPRPTSGPMARIVVWFVVYAALFLPSPTDLAAQRWVLVAPPQFQKPAQPLVDRRREQGHEVVQISVADGSTFADVQRRILDATSDGGQVLLLGAWSQGAGHIPSGVGAEGRMQGEPTDFAFLRGLPLDGKRLLGRLPARTPDEARAMVDKILRCEDRPPGDGANRLALFIGHPGGANYLEQQVGESIVQHIGNQKLRELHPIWSAQCLADMRSSPLATPQFGARLRHELQQPHLFSMFFGHSMAAGIGASDQRVTREQFGQLDQQAGPAVMFTCGCYSCQLAADDSGYALSAIRGPRGPAAVIGAHGESYAVAGRLAMDGLNRHFSSAAPPRELGAYFLAVQKGIASGPISNLTFFLFDQGDGSRGQTSLAEQRKEHLEMWTLLGDPAMRLPLTPARLKVSAMRDGDRLRVSVAPGDETASLWSSGATVNVVLECRDPEGKEDARFGAVLGRGKAEIRDQTAELTLQLPATAPRAMCVRAWLQGRGEAAVGAVQITANP
ncbi:MAG: hypothetical protein KDB14_30935 [Planctomycetales bacterium]|nr:hypothetical protein [Planctomycetales bacterium]